MPSTPRLPDGSSFDEADWEEVESFTVPSRSRRFKGGFSTQIVYRNKRTDELITRHQIEKNNILVHDHFRPGGTKQ